MSATDLLAALPAADDKAALIVDVWVDLFAASLAQAGTMEVQFLQPDRYTDVGARRDAAAVQATLRGILQVLAAERLPASQTLSLAITDVDLAGEIAPPTRAVIQAITASLGAHCPGAGRWFSRRDDFH